MDVLVRPAAINQTDISSAESRVVLLSVATYQELVMTEQTEDLMWAVVVIYKVCKFVKLL